MQNTGEPGQTARNDLRLIAIEATPHLYVIFTVEFHFLGEIASVRLSTKSFKEYDGLILG